MTISPRIFLSALSGVALALPAAVGSASGVADGADPLRSAQASTPAASFVEALNRGDLQQKRTTTRLAPGVEHTQITLGRDDSSSRWVVELSIPSGASAADPDAPARSVQSAATASTFAARVTAAGFAATATAVRQSGAADVPDGVIGSKVRLTNRFTDKVSAEALLTRLKAAGFAGRAWYEGWDGGTAASGPWRFDVLTVDPRSFRGTLAGTFGPDLERRETTSELSRITGAIAAANAGFFVMDPSAGAEGDPAGMAAYHGKMLSEATTGRPALLLNKDARGTQITRPDWVGQIRTDAGRATLDGINRVPGLIRNCGGTGDTPTDRPRHDVTCTDADELIQFTTEFGSRTPSGPGQEVVLDASGRIVAIGARGRVLTKRHTSIQATGSLVSALRGVRVGQRIAVTTSATWPSGRPMNLPAGSTILNGGPLLLRDGLAHITQRRDGMNQAVTGDPSFDYGWVLQRNPRTFAGTDSAGRTVIVAADGRQQQALGLSIPETAAVARWLGLRQAINLDGGGSTTMVTKGRLITSPSDATGERPVGDALVVLPRR